MQDHAPEEELQEGLANIKRCRLAKEGDVIASITFGAGDGVWRGVLQAREVPDGSKAVPR